MESIIKLDKNNIGRDFIIGDLHGCLDELFEVMEKVSFDKETDRLFSVGDLTDRGPKSKECAELIYKPWFFAVQGNHDRMFFTYILGERSLYHTPYDFIYNGGDWVHDHDRYELTILARDMMKKMPLMYDVGDNNGFLVAHSRYMKEPVEFTYNSTKVIFEPSIIKYPDHFVWDRELINILQYFATKEYRDSSKSFHKLTEYDPEEKVVYVGHNTTRNGNTVFMLNHMMIDTGACYAKYHNKGEINSDFHLTIVEHEQFLKDIV